MGETTTTTMPPRNTNAQQQTLTIASPNPTIDDGKTPAATTPKKIEGKSVQPAEATTTQAPMKTTKKSKTKHRRTKPHG